VTLEWLFVKIRLDIVLLDKFWPIRAIKTNRKQPLQLVTEESTDQQTLHADISFQVLMIMQHNNFNHPQERPSPTKLDCEHTDSSYKGHLRPRQTDGDI